MATITLQGTQINTNGELPKIGENAPDFVLVNSDMEDVSLATYQGKKKLLYILPSLDTPVCAVSTKKFDQLAEENNLTEVFDSYQDMNKLWSYVSHFHSVPFYVYAYAFADLVVGSIYSDFN